MSTKLQHTLSNTKDTTTNIDISDWQRITPFLNDNPQFNLGQIRWLIRHKRNNGFSYCIKKVGRSYYINSQLFAEWIKNLD